MKKILVTGGSGFIGKNFIINHLNSYDNAILNFDKLTYAASKEFFNSDVKLKNYEFVRGYISSKGDVESAFQSFSPDIVVNFAAETHVDRSIDAPKNFINTNILGTFNLLNISLKYSSSKNSFMFIHVSTDEVFGSLETNSNPFIEESPYKPSSPYSATKASSDHLVNAWHLTYNLPTVITNCSNNYGPYQFPEKLIPLIIANCIDEKPLPVYGDGLNIRDWLFVKDHCDALNLVIKDGLPGENFNIGGSNEVKNIDIVKKICAILDDIKPRQDGSYSDLITYVHDRPGHDFRYGIDSSKIQDRLGWKPNESLDTGLKKTIDWYIKNEQWWRKIQSVAYGQERLGLLKK